MSKQTQIVIVPHPFPPPIPIPIPPGPDDCCGLYSSPLNQLIAQYYYVASPMMFGNNDNIYAAEIFGKDTELLYNNQNDFNYLLCLLVMIYNERQDDIAWSDNGEDEGIDYYYEEHNLECIRRTFMCKGYDILPLLKVFDMDPNTTISNIDTPIGPSPIYVPHGNIPKPIHII